MGERQMLFWWNILFLALVSLASGVTAQVTDNCVFGEIGPLSALSSTYNFRLSANSVANVYGNAATVTASEIGTGAQLNFHDGSLTQPPTPGQTAAFNNAMSCYSSLVAKVLPSISSWANIVPGVYNLDSYQASGNVNIGNLNFNGLGKYTFVSTNQLTFTSGATLSFTGGAVAQDIRWFTNATAPSFIYSRVPGTAVFPVFAFAPNGKADRMYTGGVLDIQGTGIQVGVQLQPDSSTFISANSISMTGQIGDGSTSLNAVDRTVSATVTISTGAACKLYSIQLSVFDYDSSSTQVCSNTACNTMFESSSATCSCSFLVTATMASRGKTQMRMEVSGVPTCGGIAGAPAQMDTYKWLYTNDTFSSSAPCGPVSYFPTSNQTVTGATLGAYANFGTQYSINTNGKITGIRVFKSDASYFFNPSGSSSTVVFHVYKVSSTIEIAQIPMMTSDLQIGWNLLSVGPLTISADQYVVSYGTGVDLKVSNNAFEVSQYSSNPYIAFVDTCFSSGSSSAFVPTAIPSRIGTDASPSIQFLGLDLVFEACPVVVPSSSASAVPSSSASAAPSSSADAVQSSSGTSSSSSEVASSSAMSMQSSSGSSIASSSSGPALLPYDVDLKVTFYCDEFTPCSYESALQSSGPYLQITAINKGTSDLSVTPRDWTSDVLGAFGPQSLCQNNVFTVFSGNTHNMCGKISWTPPVPSPVQLRFSVQVRDSASSGTQFYHTYIIVSNVFNSTVHGNTPGSSVDVNTLGYMNANTVVHNESIATTPYPLAIVFTATATVGLTGDVLAQIVTMSGTVRSQGSISDATLALLTPGPLVSAALQTNIVSELDELYTTKQFRLVIRVGGVIVNDIVYPLNIVSTPSPVSSSASAQSSSATVPSSSADAMQSSSGSDSSSSAVAPSAPTCGVSTHAYFERDQSSPYFVGEYPNLLIDVQADTGVNFETASVVLTDVDNQLSTGACANLANTAGGQCVPSTGMRVSIPYATTGNTTFTLAFTYRAFKNGVRCSDNSTTVQLPLYAAFTPLAHRIFPLYSVDTWQDRLVTVRNARYSHNGLLTDRTALYDNVSVAWDIHMDYKLKYWDFFVVENGNVFTGDRYCDSYFLDPFSSEDVHCNTTVMITEDMFAHTELPFYMLFNNGAPGGINLTVFLDTSLAPVSSSGSSVLSSSGGTSPIDCQQQFMSTRCNCSTSLQTLYPVVIVPASGGGANCTFVPNSTAVCSVDDFTRDCSGLPGVVSLGLYELRVVNLDTGMVAVSGDLPVGGFEVNIVLVNNGTSAISNVFISTFDESHSLVARQNWTISSTPGSRNALQYRLSQAQIGSVLYFVGVATHPSAVEPFEFVFDWPGPGQLRANDTVQAVVAFGDGVNSADPVTLSAQICTEVRSLIGSQSPCSVVELTANTAKVALQLTAAKLLQQYLRTQDVTLLDPATYPIFRTSTQIVLLYPSGSIDPSLPTSPIYDLNCTFSACASTDVCDQGVCSCKTDANGFCLDNSLCAGGAPSHYADVCEDPSSTPNALVYTVPCEAHELGSVNLFPRRRFCQRRDRPINTARLLLTGMLGRVNVSEPVLFFTIQSPYTLQELLTQKRNASTGVVSFEAYVSNLYDGESPRNSKVWAHIEFASFYANSTVQLTKLRFLEPIEGDANYYFQSNRWHAYDGAIPPLSYAYLTSSGVAAWECQAYRVYNPFTNRCESGCDNGYTGNDCNQVINPATCWNFNSTTTLYISYSCDRVICKLGYVPGFNGCVMMSSDNSTSVLITPPPEDATSSSNFAQTIVLIACVAVVGALSVGLGSFLVFKFLLGSAKVAAPLATAGRPKRRMRSRSVSQSRNLKQIDVVVPRSREPSTSRSMEAKIVAVATSAKKQARRSSSTQRLNV